MAKHWVDYNFDSAATFSSVVILRKGAQFGFVLEEIYLVSDNGILRQKVGTFRIKNSS